MTESPYFASRIALESAIISARFLLVLLIGSLLPASPLQAAGEMKSIFSDGFESGLGNWIADGELAISQEKCHQGSGSICLNRRGSVHKKFKLTEINSPNRLLAFYWYPQASGILAYSPVMSLEEGIWDSTDKTIEMFWNGDQVYFNLYRYRDKSRTSTSKSEVVEIVADKWHKLEIASDTKGTTIKIDDISIKFDGEDKSATLTNVYNSIRFTGPDVPTDKPLKYYLDDVALAQENIVNTADLFGRTFDEVRKGTLPPGNERILAIHAYLLTRDDSYLQQAEQGADSIQSDYDSGNKNLFYIKEMALLATFDPKRKALLEKLADLLWKYSVDKNTFMPYYRIDSSGKVTNYTCYTVDPPDSLSVVNSFMFAYKLTEEKKYLGYAEKTLGAIYRNLRHPKFDTIITGVDARDGSVLTNRASRGGDQLACFIETAIFMREISGDKKYLDWAGYQADQFTKYAWDKKHKVYYYRPDTHGYEDYVPSFSLALLHLYEYTTKQTYLDNARDNFLCYMTELKRNSVTLHYIQPGGNYGHEPAHLMYDIPHIAALLYKHTGDQKYLHISDEYVAVLLDYYYAIGAVQIYSDSFALENKFAFLKRQEYTTDMLIGFILPSAGVNVSWAYGNDLFGRYRGLATAPLDVSFERDAVHLYDVSGEGPIRFHPGIKRVHINARSGSKIELKMVDALSVTPTAGKFELSIESWDASSGCRRWRESAENPARIRHVVENLKPAEQYEVKADGSVIAKLKAEKKGRIEFAVFVDGSGKLLEVNSPELCKEH